MGNFNGKDTPENNARRSQINELKEVITEALDNAHSYLDITKKENRILAVKLLKEIIKLKKIANEVSIGKIGIYDFYADELILEAKSHLEVLNLLLELDQL